jgi:hypothetical protein
VLAARDAFGATGLARYRHAAEQAHGWFLGANDGRIPVVVADRGACCDALTPDGVNTNQGAESTLVWLIALEQVRLLRAAHSMAPHTEAIVA